MIQSSTINKHHTYLTKIPAQPSAGTRKVVNPLAVAQVPLSRLVGTCASALSHTVHKGLLWVYSMIVF